MKHSLLLNILFNLLVTAAFVYLNTWALNSGLEETFIALALIYGVIVTIGNALFITAAKKQGIYS